MQAHPLSTPAARNSILATFPPASNPSLSEPTVAEGPGLAHDAGNLLGALGLYCDLLDLPGVLRPEHRHYAREIRMLSQRSTALIGRLLDDPPRAPAPTPRPQFNCPAEVLRAIAPLLRSLAAPESELIIEAPAKLPPLPFAAEIFERVLVNLTRNAATALRSHHRLASPDPEVRITLAMLPPPATGPIPRFNLLRLTIHDNGPGMPPPVAAAFMKPLPLPPGYISIMRGLGHRIVHELLDATQGRLTITVAPGRGTTLRIDWMLPAATTTHEATHPC